MSSPCGDCGGPKPPGRGRKYCDECSKSCAEHSAYTYGCNPCQKAYLDATGKRKVYRDRYSAQASRRTRQRKYSLTDGELDEVLSPGRCATCGSENNLVIDHDHATGKVRGLLCNDCNLALGKIKDSIETLENMVAYLKISQGNNIKES